MLPMSICLHGLPWWLSGEESTYQCRKCRFDPLVKKIPWKRKWQPAPVFLPEKSNGQRSLAGYSPWDHKMVGQNLVTKQQICLHIYSSLSLSIYIYIYIYVCVYVYMYIYIHVYMYIYTHTHIYIYKTHIITYTV